MSEFVKLQALFGTFETSLGYFENANLTESDIPKIKDLFSTYENELSVKIPKFKARAQETDPDKKLYGPAMVKKILDLVTNFEAIQERYSNISLRLKEFIANTELSTASSLQKQADEEEIKRQEKLAAQKREFDLEQERMLVAKSAQDQKAAEEAKLAAEKLQNELEERRIQREQAKKQEEEARHRLIAEADAKAKAEAESRERLLKEEARRKADSMLAATRAQHSSGSTSLNYSFGKVNEIQSTEHLQLCLKVPNLVIIDYYATWCGPCRNISPRIEQLANDNQDVLFLKINGDSHPALVSAANVSAYPTFLYFHNMQLLDTIRGGNINLIIDKLFEHKVKIVLPPTPSAAGSSPTPVASSPTPVSPNTSSTAPPDVVEALKEIVKSGSTKAVPLVPAVSAISSYATSTIRSSGSPFPSTPLTPEHRAILARNMLESFSRSGVEKIGSRLKLRWEEAVEVVHTLHAPAVALQLLQNVQRYAKNIVTNPSESKYRAIKLTNNFYCKNVRSFACGEELLLALGFAYSKNDENEDVIAYRGRVGEDLTAFSNMDLNVAPLFSVFGGSNVDKSALAEAVDSVVKQESSSPGDSAADGVRLFDPKNFKDGITHLTCGGGSAGANGATQADRINFGDLK